MENAVRDESRDLSLAVFCMMKKYENGKDEKIRQVTFNPKSIIFS